MHERMQERSLLGGLRGRAAAAWWLHAGGSEVHDRPVLELAVGWGDQLLEAGQVASAEVSIGDRGDCTVSAPLQGRHVLARRAAEGIVVVAPPGCRSERWIDGIGHVCEGPLVLGPGESAVVRVGSLEVALRFGRPTERVGSAERGIDLGYARALSFSAMGAVFLVATLGVTPRAPQPLGDRLVEHRPQRWVRPVAPPPEAPPAPSGEAAPKAPGDEGAIGRLDRKQRDAAPSKRRGGRRDEVLESGLVAAFDSLGAAARDVFSGGLGSGLNEAIGGLQGRGVGDAGGLGGLNARGVGPGGGGTGLSLGALGTGGSGRGGKGGGIDLGAGARKPATRIVPGNTRVIGGLSKEVIGRVIARYHAQIRACYERELQHDPALQGKVAVLFTIDGTGAVSLAETAEDTLGDGTVARCMLARIRRWKFPEPKGGGEVVVTYPWIFRAAGG